jgi:hypothetical protein
MSGVALCASVPSTDTYSALSSSSTHTASLRFSHAAIPSGVTPRYAICGALSVNSDIWESPKSVRTTFRWPGVIQDAFDAWTLCQLGLRNLFH